MNEQLKKRVEEAETRKLADEVWEDYQKRRSERRPLENRWELSMNFLAGKQFSGITASGEVKVEEPDYFWQSRNVYNHVLPIYDARLCKLAKIRPIMSVRAATDDNADVKSAELTSKILNATCARIEEDRIISAATCWSEATGTAFYCVTWNTQQGKTVGSDECGKKVYEGDVDVEVVSPFEIFPDDLTRENLEDCQSIIRARILPIERISEIYGVNVAAEENAYTFGADGKTASERSATLIERYEKPCEKFPEGRIVTVAGGEVLSVDRFPFLNAADGKRGYPFIMQRANGLPGSFFGTGVIERLIPVQRAYNAVKNRKAEFLNRIAMGVLAVEDGSVDVDGLIEDGLKPGKVIVYRQGSQIPEMLDAQKLPIDFEKEEEKLLEEFVLLGGVNEVSQNYKTALGVTSAAGLQLLLEQEDERLLVSAENIRRAVRETARHIVRLFRQFAVFPRLMRFAGEGGKAETFYFTKSDITSDDVIFETDNELSFSPSQRRSSIFEVVKSGLLDGADGKISEGVKNKLLQLLGFSNVGGAISTETLHLKRAQEENLVAANNEVTAEEYDDHALHVNEHTRFLVCGEYGRGTQEGNRIKEIILRHIAEHKRLLENPSANPSFDPSNNRKAPKTKV